MAQQSSPQRIFLLVMAISPEVLYRRLNECKALTPQPLARSQLQARSTVGQMVPLPPKSTSTHPSRTHGKSKAPFDLSKTRPLVALHTTSTSVRLQPLTRESEAAVSQVKVAMALMWPINVVATSKSQVLWV
jgi:hypothetical protein